MDIYKSIAAIINDCPAIAKASWNGQGNGYHYRGVDAVMNAFQPLLAKHKVFVVPEVLAAEREERTTSRGANLLYSILTVKYTFYAEDGSSVFAVVQGEGMDSGDKSSNKAMSAAFKYALFQVFCIPTEEMHDHDAETPDESVPARTAKPEPPKEIICEDCKKPITKIIDSKGFTWVPEALAKKSQLMSKDGKVRCMKCYKRYEQALKESELNAVLDE